MVLTRGRLKSGEQIEYAFGQVVDTYKGLRRIHHSGSYKGFRANNTMFPELRLAIVMLANTSSWDSNRLPEEVAAIYLAGHLTGESKSSDVQEWQGTREKRPVSRRLPESALREYEGKFYSEELDVTASLELEEGDLVLKLTRTSDPIYSIEKDKFLTTYANDDAYELMDRYLSFTRAADGTIDGFTMDADPIRGIGFEKK